MPSRRPFLCLPWEDVNPEMAIVDPASNEQATGERQEADLLGLAFYYVESPFATVLVCL